MSAPVGPRSQIETFLKHLGSKKDIKEEFNAVDKTITQLLLILQDDPRSAELQNLSRNINYLMSQEDPSAKMHETKRKKVMGMFKKIKSFIPDKFPVKPAAKLGREEAKVLHEFQTRQRGAAVVDERTPKTATEAAFEQAEVIQHINQFCEAQSAFLVGRIRELGQEGIRELEKEGPKVRLEPLAPTEIGQMTLVYEKAKADKDKAMMSLSAMGKTYTDRERLRRQLIDKLQNVTLPPGTDKIALIPEIKGLMKLYEVTLENIENLKLQKKDWDLLSDPGLVRAERDEENKRREILGLLYRFGIPPKEVERAVGLKKTDKDLLLGTLINNAVSPTSAPRSSVEAESKKKKSGPVTPRAA